MGDAGRYKESVYTGKGGWGGTGCVGGLGSACEYEGGGCVQAAATAARGGALWAGAGAETHKLRSIPKMQTECSMLPSLTSSMIESDP